MEVIKNRSEIPEECKWDLEKLYKDEAAYEADFSQLERLTSECESFKGRLHESPEVLAQAFAAKYRLARFIDKLSTYAVRRSDEDLGDSSAMARKDKLSAAETALSGRTSWFDPEVLAMDAAALEAFRAAPALQPYARPLERILRDKPHTLGPAEERILALLDEPLGCAAKAYRVLLNADTHFGTIAITNNNNKEEEEAQQEVQLTRGKYGVLIRDPSRAVREATYRTLYAEHEKYINTYAALLDGQVRRDVFYSRAAMFPSALAASLHNDVVEPSVYEALIAAVHAALPAFYKYVALRKRCLGLERLAMYDIYAPLVADVEVSVPYAKACEWMRAALRPLGADYLADIEKALGERWIDRYENKGKRSGAYSSGCYDSAPYILLNHAGDLRSAFTLVHECGHSVHTYLSNRAQPYHLAGYRIFVAEIASTVNECLLQHYLLTTPAALAGTAADPRAVRIYLLNNQCDDFRGTVYRQVMFAEFEKLIHEHIEAGEALTADALCSIYLGLNKLYFGDNVDSDKLISYEWSRIPHFFYNFYVYKYATSYCVALRVAASIIKGEPGAVDRYIRFLSSGCTRDPLDLIKDILGIDLTDPKVVQESLELFGKTVDDLEKELFN